MKREEVLESLRGFSYDGKGVPAHMHESITAWVVDHRLPGTFLTAVFENDLRVAVMHADDFNRERLVQFVAWLYNHAPYECWGSVQAVQDWGAK